MINQLTPDQISKYWEVLSKGFSRAIPPHAGGGAQLMTNLLESCMSGRMQVWAYIDTKIKAAALTTITVDPGTYTRNLYVYAMFSDDRPLPDNMWEEGYKVIEIFARANKCYAVTLFSDIERIYDMTKVLKMTPFMTLYYKEV